MFEGYLWVFCCTQSNAMHQFNPLNAEVNPICHLLALLRAHHIFHVSGLRVKANYWKNLHKAVGNREKSRTEKPIKHSGKTNTSQDANRWSPKREGRWHTVWGYTLTMPRNLTLRPVRVTLLQWNSSEYYIFCVCVCSLWCPACKAWSFGPVRIDWIYGQ